MARIEFTVVITTPDEVTADDLEALKALPDGTFESALEAGSAAIQDWIAEDYVEFMVVGEQYTVDGVLIGSPIPA